MTITMQPELQEVIRRALNDLSQKDAHLLNADVNERSISHRLAIYIESNLREKHPGWDVDCEYNRDGLQPKATDLPTTPVDNGDTEARTVYPDIIVHRRGTKDNLLVIELKKSSNKDKEAEAFDRQKIESYCRPPLSYRYALFLKLRTDGSQAEPWTEEWRVTEDAGR